MTTTIQFTQSRFIISEGNQGAILVERIGDGIGEVSVTVSNTSSTAQGRGTRGVDYSLDRATTSVVLRWAWGEVGIKAIPVQTFQDLFVEGPERVLLALRSATSGAILGLSSAELLILDDDWFMPQHRWQGKSLQFQNADGSWGLAVDLAGPPGPQGASANDLDWLLQNIMGPPGPPGQQGEPGPPGLGVSGWFPLFSPHDSFIIFPESIPNKVRLVGKDILQVQLEFHLVSDLPELNSIEFVFGLPDFSEPFRTITANFIAINQENDFRIVGSDGEKIIYKPLMGALKASERFAGVFFIPLKTNFHPN